VNEYELEIDSIKRALARLRAAEAAAAVIEEYEVELRNLQALYRAAQETMTEGKADQRIRRALDDLGFGDWSLDNVYAFVYEAAVDAEQGDTGLASTVDQIDFAASLLAAQG